MPSHRPRTDAKGPRPSTHTYRLQIVKEQAAVEPFAKQTVLQQQRGAIVALFAGTSTAAVLARAGAAGSGSPVLRSRTLLARVRRRTTYACPFEDPDVCGRSLPSHSYTIGSTRRAAAKQCSRRCCGSFRTRPCSRSSISCPPTSARDSERRDPHVAAAARAIGAALVPLRGGTGARADRAPGHVRATTSSSPIPMQSPKACASDRRSCTSVIAIRPRALHGRWPTTYGERRRGR